MEVTDEDFGGDDPVDSITIPFSSDWTANSQFNPSITGFETCGRASLTVSIRIFSNCPPNMYGPQCTQECIQRPNNNTCGVVSCIGNYKEPDCIECDNNFVGINCDVCAQNYYPQGVCDVSCIPHDDFGGHYTCNPVTGERKCLDGYTNPETNCFRENNSPSSSEEGTYILVISKYMHHIV